MYSFHLCVSHFLKLIIFSFFQIAENNSFSDRLLDKLKIRSNISNNEVFQIAIVKREKIYTIKYYKNKKHNIKI